MEHEIRMDLNLYLSIRLYILLSPDETVLIYYSGVYFFFNESLYSPIVLGCNKSAALFLMRYIVVESSLVPASLNNILC